VVPTPASPNVPPSNIDDIEEEDIFVPGAPKHTPGGDNDDDSNDGDGGEKDANRIRTQSAGEQSQDGGGAADESYDDLAARFAMLQKK